MTNKEHFKKNAECCQDGTATRSEDGRVYLCGKCGGSCRMVKCQNAHKNKGNP